MQVSKTLLALGLAAALLVGCKKQDEAAAAEAATATADAVAEQTEAPAPDAAAPETAAPETPDASAAPAVTAFDINKIPVSDAALPAWPYVALPAGYHYYYSEELGSRSKDLARVPVWTGGQLLWIEGKTFSDAIRSDEGKTYSKFEVRKSLQQAIEAPRWLMGRTWGTASRDLALEARMADEVKRELRLRGHPVKIVDGWDGTLGHAQAIRIDRENGTYEGGADPRGDGIALGF